MNPKEGRGGKAAPSLLEDLLPPLHPSVSGGDDTSGGGEGGRGVRSKDRGLGAPLSDGRSLVIGLGNSLRGDDGIGPAVVSELRRGVSAGIDLIESAGNDLLELLATDPIERIVVVDAADLGQAPGCWRRLSPEELSAICDELAHGMGLVHSLELLVALGLRPAPITIYAVQPAAVGWGPGLSREARRGVRDVAAAIRQELCLPQPHRRGGTVLRAEQDVRSLPCGGEAA